MPIAHAHAFGDSLPDARLAIVPGAAHFPYLEQPEVFVEVVEGFVVMSPG